MGRAFFIEAKRVGHVEVGFAGQPPDDATATYRIQSTRPGEQTPMKAVFKTDDGRRRWLRVETPAGNPEVERDLAKRLVPNDALIIRIGNTYPQNDVTNTTSRRRHQRRDDSRRRRD